MLASYFVKEKFLKFFGCDATEGTDCKMLRRAAPLAARSVVTAARLGISSNAVVATSPLGTSTALFAAANGLGFGISAATSSHLHLDIIGTGVFAAVAWVLRGVELRQRISAFCVGLWATKLAGFLFYRAFQTKHDARLDSTLETNKGALGFWAISFLWGWVVSLPHIVAAGVPLKARPPFGRFGLLSLAVFAAGLLLESAADLTKLGFKNEPANRGKFCDAGVWTLSQHPNYLGNLMVWSGITLLNVPTLLAASGRPTLRLLAAAASPLFLYALFQGQASGAVANAVELAHTKYGADPAYTRYVAETPLIFPSATSLTRALRGSKKPPIE